jgi:hypothetical protein
MKLYLSSYRLGTDTSFNRKKFGFEKPTNGHYGVIQLYFFAIVFGKKIDFDDIQTQYEDAYGKYTN